MQKVLLTWLGVTDIKSSEQSNGNLGPIAGAITSRDYKIVHIISDFCVQTTEQYKKWLTDTTSVVPHIRNVKLKDPMDFANVYDYSKQLVTDIKKSHQEKDIVFDISPGTPAMASVWIILSRTLFTGVELIESAKQDSDGNYQVRTAQVPFEISVDRMVAMLLDPDEKLKLLFQSLPPKNAKFPSIIYKCEKMERVITLARHAAIRNVPVLLLGESGTGKELIANIIHTQSLRAQKPFECINCGAIASNLIESEMFGHVKGAFTGAFNKREGRFKLADNGTLFLDEIGDLDFDLQVKLLRAIQEKKITPVGSCESNNVDVRIIAATHKNLIDEVAKGNFRSDLFYRLGVAIINIPPLRERGKDIDLLVDYYMDRINEEFAKQPCYEVAKKISSSGRTALGDYHWPGNVRELENTLKRAAMWTPGTTIDKQDILNAIITVKSDPVDDIFNQPLGAKLDINELMGKVAKHYISRAWKESGGNKSRAAELIGLGNHQTFRTWMKKYDVV